MLTTGSLKKSTKKKVVASAELSENLTGSTTIRRNQQTKIMKKQPSSEMFDK